MTGPRNRPTIVAAVMALLALSLAVITPTPAQAAPLTNYADAWDSPDPVLWFPLPPASTNPLGAPDDVCIEGSSSPGNSVAFFEFPAFAVPGGSVITGIEVIPKYRTNDNHFIQLTNGGVEVGTERTLPLNFPGQSFCSSTSEVSIGGPGDIWGAGGLTDADFSAGTVGVKIRQNHSGGTATPLAGLDSLELIVYFGNAAPTAEANGDYSVPEGGTVGLSSAGSSDPDGDPLDIDWDLDEDGIFETAADNPTFSAVGLDGPDSVVVEVLVSDGDLSDTDTATVNITNVAPTITAINVSSASIDEGTSVTVSGTFTDPALASETHTGSAMWSDSMASAVSVVGDTFSTTRTFPDDYPMTGTASDPFTVEVTIDDGDGGSDSAVSPVVTVNNVEPSIDSIGLSASSIDEGDSVTVSGTFLDPALGEVTETFSGSSTWSDGPTPTVTVGAGTFSTERTFLDDDPSSGTASDTFTVDVTIADDDLGSDTATSPTLTVNNVAPELGPLVLSSAVIDEDGSVTVSGSFTDVGILDTHTVAVDWGDGGSDPAVVVQGAGAGTFSASHQYLDDDPSGTPSDNYTITVTVTDDDTGTDSDTAMITVNNVDPLITAIDSSATFADKAEEGETVTVSGAFTDVGTQDAHTVSVDWGDGFVGPGVVVEAGGSGTFTADHAYANGGVFVVTVTVTDDDTGAVSDTTLAVVTGVGVNGGVLQVVGTSGNDHVHVKKVGSEIDVFANFISPKHRRYDLTSVASVELYLCEGNDKGNVHQSIDVDATIHGDAGRDMLWGGSGNDHIDGGAGDDKLWGRDGDDTLIGGPGNDKLFGGSGTNTLIQ